MTIHSSSVGAIRVISCFQALSAANGLQARQSIPRTKYLLQIWRKVLTSLRKECQIFAAGVPVTTAGTEASASSGSWIPSLGLLPFPERA
eukprot:scaffold7242_cov400-Prasinococcus_capsulatus_cf.AAC.11